MQLVTRAAKDCTACGEAKSLEDFPRDRTKPDGHRPRCRLCVNAGIRAYRATDAGRAASRATIARWNAEHPEAGAARQRRYRRTHPDKPRADHLARYGLTVEQYEAMVESQGGACAACRKPEREVDPRTQCPKRLAVDHCHETGAVRGLLCSRCNTTLGRCDEDPAVLRALAAYLEVIR